MKTIMGNFKDDNMMLGQITSWFMEQFSYESEMMDEDLSDIIDFDQDDPKSIPIVKEGDIPDKPKYGMYKIKGFKRDNSLKISVNKEGLESINDDYQNEPDEYDWSSPEILREFKLKIHAEGTCYKVCKDNTNKRCYAPLIDAIMSKYTDFCRGKLIFLF